MTVSACRHGGTVAPRLQARSHSEDETRALGAALGAFLVAGDLVALDGELGAGKTRFVQGLAQALEVIAPVVSPTFVVVREYMGRLRLYHVDAYRLAGPAELEDLGWEDVVESAGVVVVEWASRIHAALPPAYMSVRLSVNDDAGGSDWREVEFQCHGEAWSDRWPRLHAALSSCALGFRHADAQRAQQRGAQQPCAQESCADKGGQDEHE